MTVYGMRANSTEITDWEKILRESWSRPPREQLLHGDADTTAITLRGKTSPPGLIAYLPKRVPIMIFFRFLENPLERQHKNLSASSSRRARNFAFLLIAYFYSPLALENVAEN
jgi:hypothetical protein